MEKDVGEIIKKKIIETDYEKYLMGQNDDELFEKAYEIRIKNYGNKVYIRGIIDISNYCMCTCKFCGNACTSGIERYRMPSEEIIEAVKTAENDGIDLIHLASGLDYKVDAEYIEPVIKYCKSRDIDVELAIGIKDLCEYKKLIEMGVNRFIMKFETSNEIVFNDVKNCHSNFKEYISFIKNLKSLGICVGSGTILGMPRTTIQDVGNDLKLISSLNLDMVSTSVFMPNSESYFADQKAGDRNMALRFISLITILHKDKIISIPSNSSFGLENKIKAMKLGSNVLSVNYTKRDFEKNYSIYDGANRFRADLEKTFGYISQAGMQHTTWKEFKNYARS